MIAKHYMIRQLNKMKSSVFYFFILSLLFSTESNEEYVILVSFDGFRYDYTERVQTQNFDYLEKWGVKAKSLKPIFPSFTFPNHYSIATGCYADKHKIIGNEFNSELGKYSYKNKSNVQDPKWYGAEPIWVTAEKNGIISATYFWVGSEAPIGGYYPSYYKNYENGIKAKDKVDQVISWLKLPVDERPKLVCLYFDEPDHAGHVFGPDSKEVNDQIKNSDYILGYLLRSLAELDIYNKINLIVVSDHGMVEVSQNKVINLDNLNIKGLIEGKGPIVSVRSDDENLIDMDIPYITIASSKQNQKLHYNNSIYNYLLIADEGWMMYSNKYLKEHKGILPVKGMHGYLSDNMNMHAIFYAFGSSIKESFHIDTFELIHIYPLLCELLGINPYHDIDGTINTLRNILK